MEIVKNEKRFRYLNGVLKFLNKLMETTSEEDILKFEITFDGWYYHIKYEYRW